MEKEQKVDNIITTEDLEVIYTLLEHYKSVLWLSKDYLGFPYDNFDDYVASDICIRKINEFLKGE